MGVGCALVPGIPVKTPICMAICTLAASLSGFTWIGSAPVAARRHSHPTLVSYGDYVTEIRAFKKALERALKEEEGVPSEDTLACISAMAAVNPSKPDPATDDDLWTGEFELRSRITVPTATAALEISSGTACLGFELTESFELTAEVAVTPAGGAAQGAPNARLVLTGRVAAEDADVLRLSAPCARLELLAPDEELLAACATAARALLPSVEQVDGSVLEASGEGGISLQVLYLDQDLHMLLPRLQAGGARPIVLSRVKV